MKEKYFVAVWTKRYLHTCTTRSLRLAMWLAKLNIWQYTKIQKECYINKHLEKSECIYWRKKES